MSYIKYNDDPLARRVSDAFANLCAGDPTKKALRLLDRCLASLMELRKRQVFAN